MKQTKSAGDSQVTECYVCGGVMQRMLRLEQVEFQGLVSDEFAVTMWCCIQCHEEMLTGPDMQVIERQIDVLKTHVNDLAAGSA